MHFGVSSREWRDDEAKEENAFGMEADSHRHNLNVQALGACPSHASAGVRCGVLIG